MSKHRRRRRSWLLGMLVGMAAVALIIRRRLEPIDSAPLLPSPLPPPSEPPRIVLPAAIVESADSVPETASQPFPAPPLEIPAQAQEFEAPLLEREVGGTTFTAQPARPPAQPAAEPAAPTEAESVAQAASATPAEDEQHDHDDNDDLTGQTGYCVSCRTKREIVNGQEETTEHGRRAMRGTCPVCNNTIFRFLPNKEG